jgi:hypothetical protein
MELTRVGELVQASFEQLRFALLNADLSTLPRLISSGWPNLPANTSAVYFLLKSGTQEILYVGAAIDLRKRFAVRHHRISPTGVVDIAWWAWPIAYVPLLEALLIQIHQPELNKRGKWRDRAIIPQNFGMFGGSS